VCSLSRTAGRYYLVTQTSCTCEDDALHVLTDAGRRALAEAALFDAWPTLADADRIGTCPACHQLQTSPGCTVREHYGCKPHGTPAVYLLHFARPFWHARH